MTTLLRLPEVARRTGLKRSTIYRDILAGAFPRQVKIGPGAVGWVEEEVQEWIDARVRSSRAEAIAASHAGA